MKTKGNKALEWGRYESLRLLSTAWPVLTALFTTLIAQLATDASSALPPTAGAIVGIAAKALQQYLTNNVGKTL